MDVRKCPQCERHSVSFNYHRGIWNCVWRDCSYVADWKTPPKPVKKR